MLQVSVEVECISELFVLFVYAHADFAYICFGAVVDETVLEHELDVLDELRAGMVDVGVQALLEFKRCEP